MGDEGERLLLLLLLLLSFGCLLLLLLLMDSFLVRAPGGVRAWRQWKQWKQQQPGACGFMAGG